MTANPVPMTGEGSVEGQWPSASACINYAVIIQTDIANRYTYWRSRAVERLILKEKFREASIVHEGTGMFMQSRRGIYALLILH